MKTIVREIRLWKLKYDKPLQKSKMNWLTLKTIPKDDETYLVSWLQSDGSYSAPHRAYYIEEEGKFFSLENNNSHPIVVDIYLEMPDLPVN